MRILHFVLGRVNPESSNGVDKAVYFLSQAQAEIGHDVGIFSITDRTPIPVPATLVRTYQPERIPVVSRRNPFRVPDRLRQDLMDWNPDIVHFHSIHVPEAVWMARELRSGGIPYCVAPHGALGTRARAYRHPVRKKAFYVLFEKSYLGEARFLHAVSDSERQELLALNLDVPVVVARNCIDLGQVPPDRDHDPVAQRFPAFTDRRVFGYLGRLDPAQKGLDLLLRSWAQLSDTSSARLLLVGPDYRGGRQRLQRLAAALGISRSVMFAPPASGEDKWSILRRIDVFVSPSRWEGAPFVVLEAMAVGTPVLVTAAADANRLIEVHGAGLVTPPHEESLTTALATMVGASGSELRRMGENARRLIVQKYRWQDSAASLVAAYEKALGVP